MTVLSETPAAAGEQLLGEVDPASRAVSAAANGDPALLLASLDYHHNAAGRPRVSSPWSGRDYWALLNEQPKVENFILTPATVHP